MKNNFLLLLLLTTLLTVTYIIHEQGDVKREQAFLKEHQLFNPENLGEMQSFANAVMKITKTETGDFASHEHNLLIDPKKLDQALQILAPIQARRFIEGDELVQLNLDLAFPHHNYQFEFIFENAKVTYLIGEKIQFSQDFYMKISWEEQGAKPLTRYVIATDVSALEGVHSEETYHRSDAKYLRLLSLLFLKEDFFADTRLIHLSEDQKILSLSVNNSQNRPFIVDFVQNTTNPPPLSGLLYQEESMKGALQLLEEIQAETIMLDYEESKLGTLLSTLKIQTSLPGEPIELRLYDSYAGVEGHHALSTNRKGLFPMSSRWSQLFLAPVQSFWDRVALQMPIQITQLIFSLDESIDLGLDRSKINPQYLEQLEAFFRTPADMVSTDKPQQAFLQVKAQDQVFTLSLVDGDLILTDQKRELSFHFFRAEKDLFAQDMKSWLLQGELSE